MPCYINIEDRYNSRSIRERQQLNVWAATAVAVVGAGAAIAGGVMQSQAAGKAAGEARKLAGQQTVSRRARDIEQFLPGATAQREQAMGISSKLMGGEIPEDVRSQIMRNVAELAGAGFAPTTTKAPEGVAPISGFQAPQGLLARQLGQTSLQLQDLGMSYASSWQSQAMKFVNQVAADRMAAQTQAIGARYAANMAPAQMIQGVGSALSGAAMGYGQMKAMQGAGGFQYGTTPMGAGGGSVGGVGTFGPNYGYAYSG
jgi:hypothetical protein